MNDRNVAICVVEDDPDVCDSLEAVIVAMGHSCHRFSSAEALMDKWNLQPCDVLILDVDLPCLSGIELLSRIRRMGSNIPAIFFTGCVDERLRTSARSLGNAPIVKKGADTLGITRILTQVLTDNEERN